MASKSKVIVRKSGNHYWIYAVAYSHKRAVNGKLIGWHVTEEIEGYKTAREAKESAENWGFEVISPQTWRKIVKIED